MVRLNLQAVFQIRNGARDFENAVVAPATERELVDGGFEQIFGRVVHVAVRLELFALHKGIIGSNGIIVIVVAPQG